jgi:acetate kinase
MKVLTLNAGSRSHSARLYAVEARPPLDPPEPLWHAEIEAGRETFSDLLAKYTGGAPDVAGHRVVHPGPTLATCRSALVDTGVRAALEAAIPLAPSHEPLALEGIDAVRERFGEGTPNVAVFDAALGDDAPAFATTYPVPPAWRERCGVRRYGFHGISQRDVIDRTQRLFGASDERRLVSVHLGSGCSVSALLGRRIVETTMGMTPLEGLMMGSRSGSFDPGAIFYLLGEGKMQASDLEHALNKDSGLKGVSGVSSDTRDIEAAIAKGNERAAFALDLFAYKIRWHIGALVAVLGGIDALSFTGPAGEHSAGVRARVCRDFDFLGLELDAARNDAARPDCDIATSASRVRIAVIRTLEEWAIARLAATTPRPRT